MHSPKRPQSRAHKDAEVFQESICLYKSGLSLHKVSEKLGLPREAIRLYLHRSGVKLRHQVIMYHLPRRKLDSEVALLLGLHAGDGWISDAWGSSLTTSNQQMIVSVVSLIRSVLGVEPYVTPNKDNTTAIRSGQKQVIDFFLRYGFPRGRKAGIVRVPAVILACRDTEVIRAFLKGLFSSDGCFHHTGNVGQCRFEVSSKPLRDGFVTLAHRLEFDYKSYSYVHHNSRNKLPSHTAYMGRKSNVRRWMDEVGSMVDSHLRKYRQWRQLAFPGDEPVT